jgi:predicted acetyltransferase
MSASATAPRPASVGRWGGRSADTSSRQSCSRHTPQWRAEFVPCSPSGLAVSADGRGVHLMELRLIDCVSLIPLRESDSHIITNLMQLYKYDFSVFAEVGSQYGEVGRDGRFTYEGLESYWREEGRLALRVEADERLAGFVLVDRWSALNRSLDHAVAEFFVLRKYRRIGVGSRAARVLFERWPGRWEVAVAQYNKPALSFWRKAIPAAVDGPIEEYSGDFERHIGTVLCFDSCRTRSRPAVPASAERQERETVHLCRAQNLSDTHR